MGSHWIMFSLTKMQQYVIFVAEPNYRCESDRFDCQYFVMFPVWTQTQSLLSISISIGTQQASYFMWWPNATFADITKRSNQYSNDRFL